MYWSASHFCHFILNQRKLKFVFVKVSRNVSKKLFQGLPDNKKNIILSLTVRYCSSCSNCGTAIPHFHTCVHLQSAPVRGCWIHSEGGPLREAFSATFHRNTHTKKHTGGKMQSWCCHSLKAIITSGQSSSQPIITAGSFIYIYIYMLAWIGNKCMPHLSLANYEIHSTPSIEQEGGSGYSSS